MRDVNVAAGTVDIWSNDIVDARDRYSAQVLELNPDDIGGLTKIGGGELVLTGSVDYTGATRALGGLLTVDGSINRSEISVAETGIIGGIGALANLTAQEGGVVAPGNAANPFGTLTVTGNAVFQPGSYLWVRSAVNGVNYSKLNVGGTATLEGGNVIVKADQGNWNLRTRGMRILTADGGVTGTFDGVTSDLAFLKPTLTYEDNVVLLSLLRNDVKIASAGKTPNEQAVGGALDVMTSGTSTSGNLALEDAVLDGSLEAVSAALPYLTGEAHAALGGVATADSRIIRNAMLDRARTGSASIVEPVDGRGVYAWATGVFGQGEYDGSKDYRGFDIQSGGYVVGLDKAFERGHLGIAFAENKSELRGYDLATTADVRTRNIGLYAGLNSGAFNFRLGGAWTQSDVGTKRNVTLNAFSDQLIGDYEGDGWQAYAEVSWKAEARGTVFEPYANYAHVVYDADMKEIGGDAALSGTISEKADLITAGVRTRTALAGGEGGRPKLTLVGHLAWTENVNDDGPVFNARFADGPVFDVRAASLAGDSLTTGIGLNVEMNPRAAIDFGYSGNHGSDYTDNRLYGKLTVKF
ncbi:MULTISPECIES: autotransporter outer membrane beta-barrel domain-containing protein [unclassified Brevundimonas]|uniref:autotransporter outer membrane beta-barrel domain-containing protein n=1 Tax=unclassified Brevundimonas TaxID=2622653 RepID=UPI0025BF14DB|nr:MULTISPECIES: autotransporter domain-containing protein [unclassified Brevundimonas]